MKKKTKKESQKKNEKPFFKTLKKTWKINVKRCPTKKRNRQNRVFWEQKKTEKVSFAEVYKDTKICQESIGYRKQRDNQRTRKKQIFKRAAKGERTEKTRRDNK